MNVRFLLSRAAVLAGFLFAGITAPILSSPLSMASQPCPQSIHDQYTIQGWGDGITYHTWHPRYDPATGCDFGHEHGSDPKIFDGSGGSNPPYGEASIHGGVDETSTATLHAGFKTFVIPDDGANHSWMFTVHQGTSGAGRACTRFHEVQIAERDLNSSGHVWLKFLASFGVGYDNTGAYTYQCTPGQQVVDYGHRLIPRGDLGQGAYEPWTDDTNGTQLNLSSVLTFNTRNVQTSCASITCNPLWNLTPYGGSGGQRFMQVGTGGGPYPFTVYPGSGFFCTDAYGHNARAAVNFGCDNNGVLQYDDLKTPSVFPWYGENAKYACDVAGGPYTRRDVGGSECDMAPGLTTPN